MMKNVLQEHALAVVLCFPLLAVAQSAAVAPASASAPQLQYRSAFEGYKPYAEVKPGDWRALNEAVKDGDSMSAMPGMPAMGDTPGHTTPMPAASASSPATRATKAPDRAPSMPSMPGMSGMPGMHDHSGHPMSGEKP